MKSSHPALFTTISISPSSASTVLTAPLHRLGVGDVDVDGDGLATGVGDALRGGLRRVQVEVGYGDAEPVGAQRFRDALADALGSAGDECDAVAHDVLSFEMSGGMV